MAFPESEGMLLSIAESHRNEDDGPLLLALYYDDPEHQESDNLFEVYAEYDLNRVNPEQDLLVTEFMPMQQWPLINGGHTLRMIITNPAELSKALEDQWPALSPLLKAIQNDRCISLIDPPLEGSELLSQLGVKQKVA